MRAGRSERTAGSPPGGVRIAGIETARALRVPRVRGGLAGIEVPARFQGQLLIERRHRAVRIAGRVAQQPLQPVQGHHRVGRGIGGFHRRHGEPTVHIPLGLAERIARHEHGGRQPVRQRQLRALRQGPARGAQPRFAPTAQRQAHLMAPVVGLQRHRPLERGQGIRAPAGAFQHEAQRGPRFGQVRIDMTGVQRVGFGQPQRFSIRRRVGAGGLRTASRTRWPCRSDTPRQRDAAAAVARRWSGPWRSGEHCSDSSDTRPSVNARWGASSNSRSEAARCVSTASTGPTN